MKKILSYGLVIFILLAVGFYYYSSSRDKTSNPHWSLKNAIFHQSPKTDRPVTGQKDKGVKDYTTSKDKVITLSIKDGKLRPAKVKINPRQEIVLKNETAEDYSIKDNKGFFSGLSVKAGKSMIINLTEPTRLSFNLVDKNNRVVYKGEIIVK